MGFAGLSFLGGAAKRGSELLQEERESIEKVTDASLKFWTETGIGKYNERKNKRKDLSMKFATLANDHKFSADQIDVIARQGKTDEVLSYLATQRQRNLTVEPSDVVRFSGDYKETGRTIDQMLDGVMGKVNSGMSVSDAIQDTTGKTTGFLGQDLGKIAQARASAFSNAIGMPMGELRALSTDDITIEPSPVSGQLFMKDEVAAAQAQNVITDSSLTSTQEKDFRAYALEGLGITDTFDPATQTVRTVGGTAADKQRAMQIQLEAVQQYERLLRGSDDQAAMSPTDARLATLGYISTLVKSYQQEKLNANDSDAYVGEDNATGSQSLGVDYTGISLSELPSRIRTVLDGVTDIKAKDKLIRQAETALALRIQEEKGLNVPQSRLEAAERIAAIIKNTQ